MIRGLQTGLVFLLLWTVGGQYSGFPAPDDSALSAPPILIRHDRPDSAYIALGQRYADVLAHVEERAEGTVLTPRWVLTAAHVAEPIGPFDHPYVIVRGERYGVEKIITHPEWEGGWPDLLTNHDLALLKLDRSIPRVRPIYLYRGDDELGMEVTLVGRGKTGTGDTGPVGEKGTALRGATNVVDGASATALLLTFDSDGNATDLEGASAPGDSGNPLLYERNDSLYVVGLGSAGTGSNGHGWYGTIDIFARISEFADWIERTIAEDPPSTVNWTPPVALDSSAPTWPKTPAGTLARDFFTAYEASLREPASNGLTDFYEQYGGAADGNSAEERAVAVRTGLVERMGSLDIQGYSTAGPYRIAILIHSAKTDAWRSIGLYTATKSPYTLDRLYLKVESPDDRLRATVGDGP